MPKVSAPEKTEAQDPMTTDPTMLEIVEILFKHRMSLIKNQADPDKKRLIIENNNFSERDGYYYQFERSFKTHD